MKEGEGMISEPLHDIIKDLVVVIKKLEKQRELYLEVKPIVDRIKNRMDRIVLDETSNG